MSNEWLQVVTGIDTFSFYYPVTYKQKDRMVQHIKARNGFYKKRDYWDEIDEYYSNYYANHGIKIKIFQKKRSVWGLMITVHPKLVMGEMDRSELYQPEKKTYREIEQRVNQTLKQIGAPCEMGEMKLYRLDVTANFVLQDPSLVSDYIRILKKGIILPHYRLEFFKDASKKAKDIKEARKNSYKQSCKSGAFFAYNKTAQLLMTDHFPKTLIGKSVLRIEAQLRRTGMKKWLTKDIKDMKNWDIIKKLGNKAPEILKWYLNRILPAEGSHLLYRNSYEKLSEVKNRKTRERMEYLLRKTSDRGNLTEAVKDLREKFNISSNQSKRILKKYDKLGISPITLPNANQIHELPPLSRYLD